MFCDLHSAHVGKNNDWQEMIKERPAALKKSEVMCDLMARRMGGGSYLARGGG